MGGESTDVAVEGRQHGLQAQRARECGHAARRRPIHPAERGYVEHEHIFDAQRGGQRVERRGRKADLLAAELEPIEKSTRRNGESGLSQTRGRRPKHLALHEPAERQPPRRQDGNTPTPARHEIARCNAASNTC